jgi:hypothetical protein
VPARKGISRTKLGKSYRQSCQQKQGKANAEKIYTGRSAMARAVAMTGRDEVVSEEGWKRARVALERSDNFLIYLMVHCRYRSG